MQILYGLGITTLALAILIATAWLVDRLDAADRGAKRVPWRPWYRTGACAGMAFVAGCALALGSDVAALFFIASGVLSVLQLWTKAGVGLLVLEHFMTSLSMFLGLIALKEALPSAYIGGGDREPVRAFMGLAGWFALIAMATIIVRAIVQLCRRALHSD